MANSSVQMLNIRKIDKNFLLTLVFGAAERLAQLFSALAVGTPMGHKERTDDGPT